jgi:hypothetical protein
LCKSLQAKAPDNNGNCLDFLKITILYHRFDRDAKLTLFFFIPNITLHVNVRIQNKIGMLALKVDRNHNFQQPPVVIPEASDVEWPKAGYKELIPDQRLVFAKVTREQINGYFLYRMAGNIHLVTKFS